MWFCIELEFKFILDKKIYLNQLQINAIYQHIEISLKLLNDNLLDNINLYGIDECNSWCISEDEGNLEGYCSMDNFNMHDFLEKIVHVDMEKVEWND